MNNKKNMLIHVNYLIKTFRNLNFKKRSRKLKKKPKEHNNLSNFTKPYIFAKNLTNSA